MYKNLRWKILTILAVFALFFALGVYPILAKQYSLPAPAWLLAKHLKLGLDLQGGVQLILKVNRDDAIRISTETTSEQVREALQSAGITTTAITVTSPSTFRVEGVPQDKEPEKIETVTVTLTVSGVTRELILTETGKNTGEFRCGKEGVLLVAPENPDSNAEEKPAEAPKARVR